jgi:hypothetical protein
MQGLLEIYNTANIKIKPKQDSNLSLDSRVFNNESRLQSTNSLNRLADEESMEEEEEREEEMPKKGKK